MSKLLYTAAVKQFQFQVAMEFIMLSINGSVAFINLLGFIMLLKTRKVNIFFINQKNLILALCNTEILFLVNDSVSLSLLHLNLSPILIANLLVICHNISKTLNLLYLLLNMLILTDRFFVTFFHVKYYQRCKPSTTKMVICVTVLFAVLTAVPPLVIYFNGMYQLYQLYAELYEYVYCGTEWLILLEMVLVYVYIFRTATKNRRSRGDFFSFRNIHFTHYVPTFIVLTFVLFAVFPDQQYYYYLWIKKTNFYQNNHKFYMILYRCGFFSDTIIYVCLMPAVRKNFFRLLMKW